MIRTIITPNNTDIHVSVPESYVGKKVEIILWTQDEITEEKNPKKNLMESYWGMLSDESAGAMRLEIEKGRKEWDERLNNL